jgi:formylglycine-generating enzyme required for sulfatase activity
LSNDWEYTLPTEAQWEYACRAQTETIFSFGDDEKELGDYAWFRDNALMKSGEKYAHRVGQKKANPWGIYDVHGNVWEWCRDIYAEKLPGGSNPEVKPTNENTKDVRRISRGGGWGGVAEHCLSAFRLSDLPGYKSGNLGFRVALTAVEAFASAK